MGCQAAIWWFALSPCYGLNGVAKAPSDWGFFISVLIKYAVSRILCLAIPALYVPLSYSSKRTGRRLCTGAFRAIQAFARISLCHGELVSRVPFICFRGMCRTKVAVATGLVLSGVPQSIPTLDYSLS